MGETYEKNVATLINKLEHPDKYITMSLKLSTSSGVLYGDKVTLTAGSEKCESTAKEITHTTVMCCSSKANFQLTSHVEVDQMTNPIKSFERARNICQSAKTTNGDAGTYDLCDMGKMAQIIGTPPVMGTGTTSIIIDPNFPDLTTGPFKKFTAITRAANATGLR